MAREWTDAEVQEEIANAVQIVREDRLETFLRSRFGNQSNSENDSGDAGADKDKSSGNDDKPKRKSLWWGIESEDKK